MDEHLSDEQQAEVIRNWIRENIGFVLGGIVIAIGGLFGWQQWKDYRHTEAAQASALYDDMRAALAADRTSDADALFADLLERYDGTPYVDQARFVLARSYMDRSDFEAAEAQLAAIVNHTPSAELRYIASLRLARVRLQRRDFDGALAAIGEGAPDTAFAARFNDVLGDVYYEQERWTDARDAYEAALTDPQRPPVIDRVYVQAKIDALGGAAVAASDEALPAGDNVAPDEPDEDAAAGQPAS